jgi:inner membrane protein
VDNITHSLAGWVLGQAGLKAQSRKGLAALILGANMPDIDVFFGAVPWEPLAMHRGFTHGLVGGVLLMPPLLAGLLWLLDRWQLSRGASFKSGLPMRFGWLVALAYLGTVTHPLLDLLTTYSVQLLAPFSTAWFHADALFIIDLWLWLLFAVAIAWSRWREKRGEQWRRPAQAAVGIALCYIALNLMITWVANEKVRMCSECGRPPEAVFASPPPVESWKRNLVWRHGECYRSALFVIFADFGPVSECQPTNMDDPLVREAIRQSPRLRKFLKWSILPVAAVERGRCAARVTIGDARYSEPAARSRLSRQAVVPTGAPGCQAAAASQ